MLSGRPSRRADPISGRSRPSGRDERLRCAVAGPDLANRGEVDAFDAGEVVAVLGRHATALVMGVDAAHAAEPVLGDPGVPLVQAQLVFAAGDAQAVERDAGHDRAAAAAHGAVAATDVLVAVDEIDLELDGLAMAGAFCGLHLKNLFLLRTAAFSFHESLRRARMRLGILLSPSIENRAHVKILRLSRP